MRIRYLTLALALAAIVTGQTPVAPGKGRGVATAPILIELFSDYECPACKVFYEGTVRPMVGEYVNTGKVYLIHRDFPLPMHAHAREASTYACAAARIGKYDQVCEALFAKQEQWSKTGKVSDALSVLTPQDAEKVKALARTPEIAAEIERDMQAARDAKVNQTPTIVITHKMRRYPVGGVSYPILKRFLDSLLVQ